jgi:hypothetical protein
MTPRLTQQTGEAGAPGYNGLMGTKMNDVNSSILESRVGAAGVAKMVTNLEAVHPIGLLVADIQGHFAAFAAELRRAEERWADTFAEAQKSFAKVGRTNIEFCNHLAAVGPRIKRALDDSGRVGQLGWTVVPSTPIPLLLRLSECHQASEADALMLGWYENCDPELQNAEQRLLLIDELQGFKIALTQAFCAFRAGHYALTIPLLVSILEQALRCLDREHSRSTKVWKGVSKEYEKAKESKERFLFAIWSLQEFVVEHYKQYQPNATGEERIRRKGISHGMQPPPNSKIETIRLFHVITTVTELYKFLKRPASLTKGT